MEIVGWITIILLCALALTFIIMELGPMIHTEISSWKIRKQKALEAREDRSRFKKEMKDLKRTAKKLKYMKKHGLDTTELELGLQTPVLCEDIGEIEEYNSVEEISEEESTNLIIEEEESIDFTIDPPEAKEGPSSQELIPLNSEESSIIIESTPIEESKESSSIDKEIQRKVPARNKNKKKGFKAKRGKSLKR